MTAARSGKWLGIVGGLGPESTLDYYKMLVDRFRVRAADGGGHSR